MTALDMKLELARLLASGEAEADDVAAVREAYVGLAVTEIATLRAQLSGPQVG